MKAVVLGGAGVEGSFVVEYLEESKSFSSIRIADVAEEKGKEMSADSEKIEFKYTDATDEKSLSESLKDADVAVNCIGPFYKFAPGILEASIEEGVDIVDICDDYDVTQTLIDDYNEKAKDAGVTCVIGLGSSPGLTNILAKLASNQLSKVEDIRIYVTRGLEEEAGGAIPYHMFHSWLGEVPVYKNGEYGKARGLIDGKEYVNFPEPFGQAPVFYFGHPETVTIPRYIEEVDNVACRGVFFPLEFRGTLLKIQSLDLLSKNPVNINGNEIKPLDFSAKHLNTLIKNVCCETEVPTGGSIMVKVSGEEDSKPKTYRFAGNARMREGTSTPAAIGAEMLTEGEIDSPGAQAPEGCVPPQAFLNNIIDEEGIGNAWMTVEEKISK